MKLFEGLEDVTGPIPASTVAIGTFDGIHVGHQAIIHAAVEDARTHSRQSVVFTFDRHPAELLAPDRAPDYLTTPSQRNAYISDLGVDALIVARFDRSLAELTATDFVRDVLLGRLSAQTIVVGRNFTFGKGRSGSVEFLESAQAEMGFALVALDPVVAAGAPASSTRVRELLRAGRIRDAEVVLGHPYWLSGTVITGRKLGRVLGYPTANLALGWRQVVPQDGIYAAWARLDDGRLIPGACSIGERPTVEGAGRSIETYLFDFDEDLYGRPLELRFAARLRDEEKFDSLDALTAQIQRDVAKARALLGASQETGNR